MGACCGSSSSAAHDPSDARPPAPYPTMLHAGGRQGQDWGTTGGKRLGRGSGKSPEASAGADAVPSCASMRRRAAEAAETRQASAPGVSKARAAELRDRQQKEELLGKLAEHYAREKLEMPIGLKAASVEQLKKHWDSLRKEAN